MGQVGAYEAKTHLSSLLERVAEGERITITKHGRAVAVLVPVDEASQPDREQALSELRCFGVGRRLGDLDLKDLIEEGRRS